MAGQVRKHAQLEVGQRTDGQGNAVFGQPLHQRGILARLHAMVDAFDLQHVERGPDIGWRPFLTGMGDQVETEFAAAGEHPGEFFGRITDLA